jgi:PAS domain S-box-containing protein
MTTLIAPERRTAPVTDDRAVIATDSAGVIRHLTPAAEHLLGYPAATLIGRSLRSVHVDDELLARAHDLGIDAVDELEAVFAVVRRGGVACERQRWTYVREDSVRVRVSTTVTSAYDGEGDVMAFVVLLEAPEVGSGPAAEAGLPAPLMPDHDDYASSVSHELRTPISVILGFTELLRSLELGPLTDQQHAIVEKVEGSANRLLHMIQNVLESPGLAAVNG